MELTDEQILDVIRNDAKLLAKIQNEHEKKANGSHQKRDIVPKAIREKYGNGFYACGAQTEMVSRLIRQRIDSDGMTSTKRIMTKRNGYRPTPMCDYSDKQYEIYCWAAELIFEVLEQVGIYGETYRDKNGALRSKSTGKILAESWDGGAQEHDGT